MELQGFTAPGGTGRSPIPTVSAEIVSASTKNAQIYTVRLAGASGEINVMIPGKALAPGAKIELSASQIASSALLTASLSEHSSDQFSPIQTADRMFQMLSAGTAGSAASLAPTDQKLVQTVMQLIKDMPPEFRAEFLNRIRETVSAGVGSMEQTESSPENSEAVSVIRTILTELLDALPKIIKSSSAEPKDHSLKLLTQILFPAGSQTVPQQGVTPLRTLPQEIFDQLAELPEQITADDSPAQNSVKPAPSESFGSSAERAVPAKPAANPSAGSVPIPAEQSRTLSAESAPQKSSPEPILTRPTAEKAAAALTAVLKAEPLSLVRYSTEPYRDLPAEITAEVPAESAVSVKTPVSKPDLTAETQKLPPLYQKIASAPSMPAEIVRFISSRFPTLAQSTDLAKFAELFVQGDIPLDEKRLIPLESQLRALPEPQRTSPFVKSAVETALASLTLPKSESLTARIISIIEPVTAAVDRLAAVTAMIKERTTGTPVSQMEQTAVPAKESAVSPKEILPVSKESADSPKEILPASKESGVPLKEQISPKEITIQKEPTAAVPKELITAETKPLELPASLKESAQRLEKAVTDAAGSFAKLFAGDSETPKAESLKKLGDSWGVFLESSLKKWGENESKPELDGVKQELKRMNHLITKELVALSVPGKSAEESPLKTFLKDLGKTVTESIHRIEGGQILSKPNDTPADRSQMLWIPVQVGTEWTRMGIEFRREKDKKGRKGSLGNRVAISMDLKKMGQVSAELDLDANKQLRVKLGTSSPAALSWFRAHEQEIHRSLQNEKLRAVLLNVAGIRRESIVQSRPGDSFKVSG